MHTGMHARTHTHTLYYLYLRTQVLILQYEYIYLPGSGVYYMYYRTHRWTLWRIHVHACIQTCTHARSHNVREVGQDSGVKRERECWGDEFK